MPAKLTYVLAQTKQGFAAHRYTESVDMAMASAEAQRIHRIGKHKLST